MTIGIGQQPRHDTDPALTQPRRSGRLMAGVVAFGFTSMVVGFLLAILDALSDRDHLAIYAVCCFILTGLAGVTFCVHKMLAEREAFYRRGQFDGWMKGWRGQDPEVNDPLLR